MKRIKRVTISVFRVKIWRENFFRRVANNIKIEERVMPMLEEMLGSPTLVVTLLEVSLDDRFGEIWFNMKNLH